MDGSRSAANKTDRTRRAWTQPEELALIEGLKKIIAQGWRSDIGFKTGYLKVLETYIMKAIPGTELRAIPHINSRLSTWKKSYASLSRMIGVAGISWNESTKLIDVSEDRIWEDYVRKDPYAHTMRYKRWPYYPDWIEIFGKDRPSGEHAEDITDAINNACNLQTIEPNLTLSPIADDDNHREEIGDHLVEVSISQASGSNSSRIRSAQKSRQVDPQCEIVDMLGRSSAEAKTMATRRAWTRTEELALIQGLKEIVAQGWRSDDGFKTGYLKVLEIHIMKAIPGTKLRATPHITSKLTTWKKFYISLSRMMGFGGIEWNDSVKMIDVRDYHIWEEYVKKDPQARTMRNKTWPYYPDWIEIFGKDMSSGDHVENVTDPMNNACDPQTMPQTFEPNPIPNNAHCEEMGDHSIGVSMSQASGSISSKKRPRAYKKRRLDPQWQIADMLGRFCAETTATLRDIASRIGYDIDVSKARKSVFAIVDAMQGLSDEQKFNVCKKLVNNTEELELFFSLPQEKKRSFAMMKLSGRI